MPSIQINGRLIGIEHPTYIIAELSANHNQDFDTAVQILKAASDAGADAVKLQTYTPDTMTIRSDKEHFKIDGTLWDGRDLYDLYSEAYTPWDWQPRLKEIADELNVDLFSTPFDETAVDFLEKMNVPAYKVASFELIDLPLLRRIALTGKPIILSTGMGTLAEIDEAVSTISEVNAGQLALLKCTSAYPAPPDEMNLNTIPHLSKAFNVPVGLSDHTLGIAVPVTAVALGARLVEKHLTLSRATPGPDSSFSLKPGEFKEMVRAIRVAENSIGKVHYGSGELELKSRQLRRSLFVVKNVHAGEMFTPENVRCIRPGHGMHPRFLGEILGRFAARDIDCGTPLAWDLVGNLTREAVR